MRKKELAFPTKDPVKGTTSLGTRGLYFRVFNCHDCNQFLFCIFSCGGHSGLRPNRHVYCTLDGPQRRRHTHTRRANSRFT